MKKTLLCSLIITIVIALTSCGEVQPVSKDNYFLDTTCNITVYQTGDSLDEATANEAIDGAYKLCAKLEKLLSKTIQVSDVSKINDAKGDWVAVSDYTIELLNKGIEYSKLSNGQFDITVGGITEQWDFHTEEPKLPNEGKLADAVKHIGYSNVEIDENRVHLLDPETQLDLGGIAKGYIGDKIAEYLEKKGVTSAIVNLGGNIICIGAKPVEDSFTIGVETPFSDRTEIVGSVQANDQTLVTSGVYERMFKIDDKIYHHILDAETGWPVDTDIYSVTLIADCGHSVDCDALSTTCLIKGYKNARKFIESRDGIEAVFVLKNGDIVKTDGAKFTED